MSLCGNGLIYRIVFQGTLLHCFIFLVVERSRVTMFDADRVHSEPVDKILNLSERLTDNKITLAKTINLVFDRLERYR